MKRILLFVFAASFAVVSSAQTPQTDNSSDQQEQSANTKVRTNNQLGLSSDQQQQMRQINQNKKIKKQSIMNDNSLSEEQKQEQLKSVKSETRNQKQNLLTPDQRAKQKQLRKANKQNRNKRNGVGKHTSGKHNSTVQ